VVVEGLNPKFEYLNPKQYLNSKSKLLNVLNLDIRILDLFRASCFEFRILITKTKMYLKRVEISGFKSFAAKTNLDFLPSCSLIKGDKKCGITAIVGPNGSGKSNVADAIKWAMGEQSLKNLRGRKSEDIIFAGSGKKAQMGSAKVSLFFDNADKKIPIEFSEVVITRKLYRSGESEYLINGSRVRLIDIVDILAKGGIGQRSYCIINQGMADAVLDATAAERRIILEEAAGVKPYQLKKDRSLRKLDSSRGNLQRVYDLIREIEPHLKVLKRQSEKARKGEEVAEKLREKQELLYGFYWRKIEREKEKILEEKEEIGREEMKLQRQIDNLEIKVKKESSANEDFENKRNNLEKKREEIFADINQLRKQLAVTEARIEMEKEKEKAKNFEMIDDIPIDFLYIKEEFKKIRAEYEEIERDLNKISSFDQLEKLKKKFSYLRGEMEKLCEEICKGKKARRSSKRENVVDLKVIGELENRKNDLARRISILNQRVKKNKREIDNLFREDRESRSRYFELEAELRERQSKINIVREKLNETRINLAKLEVKEEDLRKKVAEELSVSDPSRLNSIRIDEELLDTGSLEREVNRLKAQAEQIGAIDPMIIEEYEETQKRHDFLKSQSRDLEKAIVSLVEIVKEMDDKIKISFEKTFEKVNADFSKYFKIIFGGGNAELIKIKVETRKGVRSNRDDEGVDELNGEDQKREEKEMGIEIKAVPPGKKISSLNMLSGGERALTSQALLFAIISNNPPPFAVLDEIEAALDEANSRRFSRILHELSCQTQFVLITHNRETMRQASILYGVTMGDDGVSKVLSVKLDQVGKGGELKS